jgi:hypothetical protein
MVYTISLSVETKNKAVVYQRGSKVQKVYLFVLGIVHRKSYFDVFAYCTLKKLNKNQSQYLLHKSVNLYGLYRKTS